MQKPNKGLKLSNIIMYLVLALVVIGCFVFFFKSRSTTTRINREEFIQYITTTDSNAKITSITARPAGGDNDGMFYVYGEYQDQTGTKGTYDLYLSSSDYNEILKGTYGNISNNVATIDYAVLKSTAWVSILISLLPIILIIGFFYFSMRGGGNKQAFDFGKSRARLSKDKTVTFKDVAGCDEEKQELVEIVDFLKNPAKYVELGARIPKGVLLFGPPGTGKTLLAKAVAGEANVPFFSISGSDFVEMFVGVGASRVRDLFKQAKENHPCIVFIDEIDAVGRQRGAGLGGGHDEREQTLNQLLVEMDGFGNNSGIIVMAATNRPDILDPALLRPGRFDRQITISAPDVVGREAILKVHARNKKFASNVHFNEVAQRIPGFSGAEIENLLNEAALLAARANRKVIDIKDIDEAVDRVLMGPAKVSRKYTEHERRVVAYHESGHAVIGLRLDNANVVQKVTIIPRGQAGGYNLMMPLEETFLHTKQGLLDEITGYLGGRVAEEIIFGEITTGAHNDIERATKIARAMVTEYGMSSLGPVQLEHRGGNVFLGRDYMNEKNFSDQVAAEIDTEVRKIINECYKRAQEVISANIQDLHNISKYLLEIETLNKPDIDEIAATGKLKWWDEKKENDAKINAEAEKAQDESDDSSTPLLDELEKNDEIR